MKVPCHRHLRARLTHRPRSPHRGQSPRETKNLRSESSKRCFKHISDTGMIDLEVRYGFDQSPHSSSISAESDSHSAQASMKIWEVPSQEPCGSTTATPPMLIELMDACFVSKPRTRAVKDTYPLS